MPIKHDRLMDVATQMAATALLLSLTVEGLKAPAATDLMRAEMLERLAKYPAMIDRASQIVAILAHITEVTVEDVVTWATTTIHAHGSGYPTPIMEVEMAKAIVAVLQAYQH